MSKVFNKDTLRNVIIAILVVAISYLFVSFSAMQKSIFMGQEHNKAIEQTQIKMGKQWSYITENKLGIRENKTNITWLIKLSK